MTKKAKALSTVVNETSNLIRGRLAAFLGKTHQGTRDTYEVFGYPKIILPEMLYDLYSRNDIANRIVSAYPKATWRDQPVIRDEQGDSSEKNTKKYSPFVEAIEGFFDDKGIMRMLERADRLSGIGRYGVLFLGFAGEKDQSKPLREGKNKLLFASPYYETNAQITQWDTDTSSPRFGLPLMYTLLNSDLGQGSGASSPKRSLTVHHSRIIHMSEFLDQDDTFGLPRLQPIFNRFLDLEKVVGGSAETFWLTANRGIAFWADKEAALSPDAIQKVKDQADEFTHKLRRTIVGQGMSAQVLGSEDPDPEPNATILLDLIAGSSGIPKRILLGTERGELASSQDENNWSSRIDERRNNYAGPAILRKFVKKMIETGNLPEPKGKWWIEWPTTGALGPDAEADIMVKKTTALTLYANTPGVELIVPMQEFRTDYLGMTPESEYEIELPEEIIEEPVEEPSEDLDGDPSSDKEFVDASEVKNMKPKPLYVRRDVKNKKAITDWAKAQGIIGIVDDLHVTVCYSKKPVDWLSVAQSYGEDDDGSFMVHPGGPRVLEQFGDCLVLSFVSDGLSWRNRELQQAGCSHDYPKYQSHITISKAEQKLDIDELEPYTGAIALGPEIFEEAKAS